MEIHSISTNAKFGDKRLNIRFEKILNILSIQIEHSIPRTFKKWTITKAVYRFLNNKKVTQEAIIESQYSSWSWITEKEIYLAIHDTTELDYTGHRSEKHLGCLEYENKRGVFLHNTLLCDGQGIPQGVFHQHFWSRDPESLSKKKERKHLSIEEKESNRWVESVVRVDSFFKEHPLSTVVNICDREGDIYELLSLTVQANNYFIVRSCNNRKTHNEDDKIWDQVKKERVQNKYDIEITDRQTFKKRVAHLEVRWLENILLSPPYRKNEKLTAVKVNIIYVQEINPPAGEKPIDWKLLTSLSLGSQEQVLNIITYYSYRWRIETFHYILKQGCNIESLQLAQEQSLKNAISLYSLMACRLLAMMYLSREKPSTELCAIGFTDHHFFLLRTYLEKNYEFKFNQKTNEPTIQNFTQLIGMLGGYLKHNSPHPGIKVLWRGMREFLTIINCFEILNENKCG